MVAQAVYLRTEGRIEGYQPFTTNADLVLDPRRLEPIPLLGDAMTRASFTLTDEAGIWEAPFKRPGLGRSDCRPRRPAGKTPAYETPQGRVSPCHEVTGWFRTVADRDQHQQRPPCDRR